MKKLTPAMADLLTAMQRGAVVHWIGGISAYYFRSDTFRSCTATVDALVKRGLLVESIDPYGRRTATLPTTPRGPQE